MNSSTGGSGPHCSDGKCDVQLIAAGDEFISASHPTYSSPDILLPPRSSSLLYFTLPPAHDVPLWLYAHVICQYQASLVSSGSDALITLLLWTTPTAAFNATNEQQAVDSMSLHTYNSSYSDPHLSSLSTQRGSAADFLLLTELTQAGYYGLLLTNTNSNSSSHNFTVSLSSYSERPVVSPPSAFSFNFPLTLTSLGLFFLFLLLSSLCLVCLVLGRRYLAGFRRKGGKKYHGVSKLPEGDSRGGPSGGGGGLDGRVEGGDTLDTWDAEMKEMDSLELQLSDEGEQSEFELNEIATIYRQPQPQPPPQPQQQQQQQSVIDGGGKRSPVREETKTNGSGGGGERVIGSPIRVSSGAVESARQSPPPIAQPVVQAVVTDQQQRVQPPSTSARKKKKKKREEGSELSEV